MSKSTHRQRNMAPVGLRQASLIWYQHIDTYAHLILYRYCTAYTVVCRLLGTLYVYKQYHNY